MKINDMYKYRQNREFQNLAHKINAIISNNGGAIPSSKEGYEQQKAHVEKLYALEKKLKREFLRYQQIYDIYKQFTEFIKTENGNILTAQPFFRESGRTFSSRISKAIKDDNVVELVKFDINSQLINFIIDRWGDALPSRLNKYYNEFTQTRNSLIENNLPLAINRAKKFYRVTPQSHLFLLDLVNICVCGLAVGVDKYTGPYTKVWRSVCIGRMVGFMIEEYSKTFIRMYPSDRQILYRANALKHKLKLENTHELTKAVNESFAKDRALGKKVPDFTITEAQITSLMHSSSYISADSKPILDGDEGEIVGYNIYDTQSDQSDSQEDLLIKRNLLTKILLSSHKLDTIEIKIIRLKGVSL